MTEMVQFIAVLLAAFGMVCLGWLVLGALLLPGGCPARIVIAAKGDGGGLEQAVKEALWLRRSGLWRGGVVIEDCGLDRDGAALARTLAEDCGVEFARAEGTAVFHAKH